MKTTIYKFAVVLIIVPMILGVFNVGKTFAYFSDTATVSGNTFSLGILDFNITPGLFDPTEASLNFGSGTTTNKEIDFALAPTSMGVTYFASTTNMTGDMAFCNQIGVSSLLNGSSFGSGSLVSFKSATTTNNATTTTDVWKFNFTLPTASSAPNSICSFNFEYNGRQSTPYLQTGGFSDVKTATSTLYSWGFRINKVYYNVASDKGTGPDNQWVEIYNQTDQALDITGWKICNNDSCDTIPSSSPVPAKGYAVITDSSTTWNYWDIPSDVVKIVLGSDIGNGLANDKDMLVLERPDNLIIDQMNWGTPVSAWNNFNSNVWTPGAINVVQGNMLGRKPNGYDTNEPSDFVELKTPTVAMVNPVGKEVWYVGDPYDVQWTAHSNNADSADSALTISLWYSIDSGATWAEFASNLPNTGSYNWTIPLYIGSYYVPSETARIKAVAVGPENFMVQGFGSSQDFCPPIDYDALSPADQQLVDRLVASGTIDPSVVIKGGIVKLSSDTVSETVTEIVASDATSSPIATSTDPGSIASTTESVTGDSSSTTTPETTLQSSDAAATTTSETASTTSDFLPADTETTEATSSAIENEPVSDTIVSTEPVPTTEIVSDSTMEQTPAIVDPPAPEVDAPVADSSTN